jgi:glycine/D-amino acid oxidase-like deaminating enzyme/nitrite reductase/ring-hydroxylating ferredoxin subunit
MTSKSLWMSVAVAPQAAPLQRNEQCDVVVVGSGIAGLSTAYELSLRGRAVIVIDRGPIAGGMTARTSAHLAPLCDDLMSEMQKIKGADLARLFYKSQAAGVDRIEQIQREENIDCDFRRLDGFLFQGDGMPADVIDEELDAVRGAGAKVERLVGVPLSGCDKRHVLRYPDQATFHPLKYLAGLAKGCAKRGVRFFAHTPVMEVAEEGGAVTAKTARGSIRAGHAVIATNSPIVDQVALHSKMAPYRTYVLGFAIARGALPDALYWDTEEPYHYVRLQPGEAGKDFVLVGGEDHKSGEANDAEKRFAQLEQWARGKIPALEQVTHRWSGQVLDTIDYVGFVGKNPSSDYTYVHTGDSGQGLTHGAAGAMLNAALVTGESSPWEELYAPGRTPIKAAKNWVTENVTALKNLSEYVAPGEIGSADELQPGEGGILRSGLKKIAAYRDIKGDLHQHSAACTHLGCHLHWNSFESCWDCPCHGSMFGPDGRVMNAPAIGDLEPVGERPVGALAGASGMREGD